jgi:tetratricopeptide (TPR) repeat protein
LFARRWDPAIEQLHRAIQIDPNFWFGHCFLGRAYEQKGKLPEAIFSFNGRSNWKRIMPRPGQAWDMHMRCRGTAPKRKKSWII